MNFIGIDFGTHNCSISIVSDSIDSESFSNSGGDSQVLEYNIPSIIHIGDEILIGDDAINLNVNNISYFKRILCLKENEKHMFNFDYYNHNETIYIKTIKGDL